VTYDEEAVVMLTDEQKQELLLNKKNIMIEMLVPGDGESFPVSHHHLIYY